MNFEQVRVAVVYYSATGTVHTMAQAVAQGAEKAGADVRLRKIAETASAEQINARTEWAEHVGATAGIPVVELADLEWADAVLFGTPTRFGNVAAPVRAFMETTNVLWFQGKLADKVYSGFTSSSTAHGGQETTLLALYNTFYHWGGLIVPPGYTDPIQFKSGNPYGTSHVVGDGAPGEITLRAAQHQGHRAADIAASFKAGRAA